MIKDGLDEEFYFNGNLHISRNYKNELLDGEWKIFHSNGKLYELKNYKQNKLHGKYEVYSIDGEFRLKSHFKNGFSIGLVEFADIIYSDVEFHFL